MSVEDSYAYIQAAANAYYELSGPGIEFALKHTDAELRNGNFKWADEKPFGFISDWWARFRSHPKTAAAIVIVLLVVYLLPSIKTVVDWFK